MNHIHAISLNTAVDMRMVIPQFVLGGVVRALSYTEYAAGKAVNNVRAIASLGFGSCLYCFSGQSDVDLFSSISPLVDAHVVGVEGATRRNLTLVNSQSELICHVQNSGYCVGPQDLEQLEHILFSKLTSGDVVVVSGSIPDGASTTYLNLLGSKIKAQGGVILLDIDPALLGKLDCSIVSLVKPNLEEMCRLAGRELVDVRDIVQSAQELIASEHVVVSLGKEGAVWIDRARRQYVYGKITHEESGIADAIGCGDSMVGALALGIAQDADWKEIFKMGISCGYANVFLEGPGIISMDHYLRALDSISLGEQMGF